MGADNLRCTVVARDPKGDAFIVRGEGDAFGAQSDLDALVLQDPFDRRGHVLVVAANEAIAHLDHRDPAAETAVHLRELETDVAAADDDQVLGKKVELHHARACQIIDTVNARKVGHVGAGARVDKDPVGLEQHVVHPHGVGGFESSVAAIDRAVLHVLEPVRHAFIGLANDGVLARLDALHVHVD